MAKFRSDQPLIPSVLDRLIDNEPDSKQELPRAQHQVLRDLKDSVRRDLQNLLNTHQRCSSWPADLDELDFSLLSYGTPDFTGVNMNQPDQRERLRATTEQIIRRFEPRFKSVKVMLLDNVDEFDRTLRFRIDALLQSEPAPEPVVFDSMLEPATSSFSITRLKT